jgi:hypothetical protein
MLFKPNFNVAANTMIYCCAHVGTIEVLIYDDTILAVETGRDIELGGIATARYG